MTIESAYKSFKNEAQEDAIVSSTKASWGGSGCSVELFEDGSYRVLWNNQIGNRYDSPGLILGVPSLDDDEWDEGNGHFFDNAIEAMDEKFKEWKVEYDNKTGC